MFDKLVESTKQRDGRGAGRYFAAACGVYAFALTVLGVGTILTFSPVLAEQHGMMLPIVVQGRQEQTPQPQRQKLKLEPVQGFVVPKKPIDIPDVGDVNSPPRIALAKDKGIPGSLGNGDPNGVPGGVRDDAPTPPPPHDIKKKQITETSPDSTPAIRQGPSKVSEGVLVGSAIRKVKPAYPRIARAARASGAVQVQVTISEEGNVIGAVVLNGHPLLRTASLEAARQWVFSPTTLSKVPVKVQGVLTFNFTLE